MKIAELLVLVVYPFAVKFIFSFLPTGIYYAPHYSTLEEYRQYIEGLPLIDSPEIFGMHENANIAFQTQETHNLIFTILDVQPRVSSGGAGKSNDEIVYELADSILAKLMDKLDIDLANQEMFEADERGRLNSLTTVLTQEVDRFNKLLVVIKVGILFSGVKLPYMHLFGYKLRHFSPGL